MNVLKFGGTSVANAQNIKLVCDITAGKAVNERLVVVVSAFSGVTDSLLLAATKAAAKDHSYKGILSDIETRHVEVLHDLIAVHHQSTLLAGIKSHVDALETLLAGCFLLGE